MRFSSSFELSIIYVPVKGEEAVKPGPEMPPRSLRVASLILCFAPTKRALESAWESSFPLLCHTLSVWILLLCLINSLIGLFVCSYSPRFILIVARGKTPVPSAFARSFPLHSCSNQGVLFTYQCSQVWILEEITFANGVITLLQQDIPFYYFCLAFSVHTIKLW